ncbi:MAG: hypothetical protein U5K32_13200 [Bacteroidales bacterium]|nr:hypothetical protein [Bacteroidales bacterium]
MRKMKYILLLLVIIAGGCTNKNSDDLDKQTVPEITEQEDGSIVLDLEKAYLLQDSLHPDMNTAEWSFRVESRGRYELWLSSFTKDTMDLHYDDPVIVNFEHKRIRANPVGNEIILDTPGTGEDYYRADSRIGSLYIDSPGGYSIQIVSAKVRPCENIYERTGLRHTELRSLILKPMTE